MELRILYGKCFEDDFEMVFVRGQQAFSFFMVLHQALAQARQGLFNSATLPARQTQIFQFLSQLLTSKLSCKGSHRQYTNRCRTLLFGTPSFTKTGSVRGLWVSVVQKNFFHIKEAYTLYKWNTVTVKNYNFLLHSNFLKEYAKHIAEKLNASLKIGM